jgi:hypothetical protein
MKKETIGCPCGNASMTYEIIDIDLYTAEAYNTIITKEGYGKACICQNCKRTYDHFDHCMVIDIRHTGLVTEYSSECKPKE